MLNSQHGYRIITEQPVCVISFKKANGSIALLLRALSFCVNWVKHERNSNHL